MEDLVNNEPCSQCGRWANRGVSVDAVIIKDGSILLIQRGVEPNKGSWGTPGGYVDWDESVEDANVAHLVTVAEGVLRHGDDAMDAQWFPLDDLPEHMALDHKSIISDARKL